jgi:hypothetical protein
MLSLLPPHVHDIFDDNEPGAGASPLLACILQVPMTTMGKTFENLPLRKLLPLEAPHPPANLPRAADSEDHLGPVHMHRCCLSHVKKGTDRSGGAKDVWTFFDPTVPQGAQKQECMFCRSISYRFCLLFIDLLSADSSMQRTLTLAQPSSPPQPALVSCASTFTNTISMRGLRDATS